MTKRRRWGTGAIWRDGSGFRARHRGTGNNERFKTRGEAEDWLRRQNKTLRRKGSEVFSITGDQPHLTFGGAWKEYGSTALPHRNARSASDDRGVWARLLRYVPAGRSQPFWKVQRIQGLRQGHVEDYKLYRTGQRAAPDTLRLELALLRRLANWAEERGLCTAPRFKWRLPVGRSREAEPVSEAVYRKLLENASSIQKAMLVWYWGTGCRPSELTAIHRKDLDTKSQLVTIPSLKTGRRTGRPTRKFPLEKAELIQTIKERDTWLRTLALGGDSHPSCTAKQARARLASPWLFPARNGKQMSSRG